jgi:hypothetical protein
MSYSNYEIMIDLETQSIRPNASILTIGAIKFKRNGILSDMSDIDKKNIFYRRITLDSAIKYGLHIDPETMQWWNTQKEDAIYEVLKHPDRVPLDQALVELAQWIGDPKYVKIWANSPDFDLVILKEAYRSCGKINILPFKFWMVRCTRTIYDLGNVKLRDFPNDKIHHSLYDCYNQIKALEQAYKNIFS